MDKLVKFVECLVPISACNLRCSYCYVIQENRRDTKANLWRCDPEKIGEAFNPNRWGGIMLVNLCGFGETLIPKEMPKIIYNILKQGHYVNVTNNGTMSKRFDEIIQYPPAILHRLCFSFSFHYIELKKKGLLREFVENVKKVKNAECSYIIQLNLADEYIDCIEEIKEFCMVHFGTLPQIALTRKEGKEYEIYTNYSEEKYIEIGRSFNSPLFDFTCKNFRVKRKEFCYAGKWSYKLDLASGDLKSCYFSAPHYNIYKNIHERIPANTIGNNCKNSYCVNSSHFMSLGIIPEIQCPTYCSLRERDAWYTKEMREFLEQKLYDNNKQYSENEKRIVNIAYKLRTLNKYFHLSNYTKHFKGK